MRTFQLLSFNSILLNFFTFKGKAIEDADSHGIERGSFPVLGWYLKNSLFHSGNYLHTLRFLLRKGLNCH